MTEEELDTLTEEEARDMLRRIVLSLNLAQDDGVFGKESWQGYLEIEE